VGRFERPHRRSAAIGCFPRLDLVSASASDCHGRRAEVRIPNSRSECNMPRRFLVLTRFQAGPAMARLGLLFVAVFAGVGFVACLALHVIAFFATPPGGGPLFVGLMFAVFPLHVVVTLLTMRSMGGLRFNQRWGGFWDRAYPDCPVWMRRVVLALQIYAGLAILFLFTTATPVGKNNLAAAQFHGRAILAGSSAVLLMFYGYAFVAARTLYRRAPEQLTPRCQNGHPVARSDRFCPQCGVPIKEP
jgi:hypothetical protein